MKKSKENLWQPSHGEFRKDVALARIEDFAGELEQAGLAPDSVVVSQNLQLMEQAYEAFESPDAEPLLAGGHAFIAPSRLSRNNMEPVAEAYGIHPMLRELDLEAAGANGVRDVGLRVMRLIEVIPPRIMESYTDLPGGIVYAPVTLQIKEDYNSSQGEAMNVARDIIAQTVGFAAKQGANVVGLGATLPSLTRYGEEIKSRLNTDDIAITTGHGGTAWLASRMALHSHESQTARKTPKNRNAVGILGLGAMGTAMAHVIADDIKDSDIVLFDSRLKRSARTATNLQRPHNGRIRVAISLDELFRRSSVVVSAVTTPVELAEIQQVNLEERIIIDDSQPAAFKREEVMARGAALLWVIGDSQDGGFRRSSGWNYGGSMLADNHLFGCEAEAAVISTVPADERHLYAIDHEANTADIRKIGGLFLSKGIGIAPPQSHGQKTVL